MKYNVIIPYAMDFASFLLGHLPPESVESISHLILFGSGARGEQRRSSDVDLFIEVSGDHQAIEKEIDRCAEEFYDSVKYTGYWKLKGFGQPFSCKVGDQKAWKQLYPALLSDGIVLYGKYVSQEVKGKPRALFFWENVPSATRRIHLYRSLHGYKARGKTYPGLLERYGGTRLTKGCILVPLEHHQEMRDMFRKLKVPVKELLIHSL